MFSRDPSVCFEGSGPYTPHTVNVDPRKESKEPHIIIRNRDYRRRTVGGRSLRDGFLRKKFKGLERGELASYDTWFRGVCREYG